ncbi:MCE family protein [Mycobacterium sp. AMU20-3851]|uniref:MCE family protein n=1 Tax=Mycobacterium sp. AMU20-3851 TaxID=3122055 RepID=UPI0037549515
MTGRRGTPLLAGLVATVSLTAGCGWQGANSLPLPGTEGSGPGAYTIMAQLPDVGNVQRNSRVRVGDVTVGSVTAIERQGWHALLTIRLNSDVDLPANSTATVGQTSLLGSLHIELAPPVAVAAEGRLHEGSLIPLSAGGSYPTTEQTLAALSLVLNGGGLGRVHDITHSLSTAFAGRAGDLSSLVEQVDIFVGNVENQTRDIIDAADSVNRLVAQFAARTPVLDRALDTIPRALDVLADRRAELALALDKLGQFGALTAETVNQTKDDLITELNDLGPVLESLANAGPAMVTSLSYLTTFPFVKENIGNYFRGDYVNLTGVFDLTLSRLDAGFLTGTRFEGSLTELEMQWGRTIGQMPSPYTGGNPLSAPYIADQGR